MMSRELNYTSIPSLKHIALVKIAVALWNQPDISVLVSRVDIELHRLFKIPSVWQDIILKVEWMVSDLALPQTLKKEILNLIQPIGLEIKKWRENYYTHTYPYFPKNLTVKLCWTPQGTVQEKKTAELLVKDDTLTIKNRFIIACVYCLEEEIKELWNSMSQREKNQFDIQTQCCPLVIFWICHIQDELFKFCDLSRRIDGREITPYQSAFEISVFRHLKEPTEYFLQKLTPGERDDSLVRCSVDLAKKHFNISTSSHEYPESMVSNYADILCFLLSQMNQGQQAQVLESAPAGVLSCLLCWPRQSFFMETANRVWDFLPEQNYQTLLKLITIKMVNFYKDYNYQNLLVEFWENCPSTFKKSFLGNTTLAAFLFLDLNMAHDKEDILLILKNATVKEKEDILTKIRNKIIPECETRDCEVLLFEFPRLICFLDDIIHNNNEKRSMEDGNSSPAKKLKF